MKKIISLFLAVIMLLSASGAGTAYAAQREYVEDVLAEIQTKSGFVPNRTSIVTGNCYAFVSAVCERLYGVKYQEGLNSNGYTCRHETGLFYAVSTYKTTSSNTADCVEDIINFFVKNAYPGDIVHYASLSGSTHTFMIQSIDSEKMSIFHSNYQTRNVPSTACHIDNIYWSSFRKNPTSTIYNNDDGSMYSHNSIFYNKQKRGGLGISINRYVNYEKMYYPSFPPPTLSATNSATKSIDLSWTKVEGALYYAVQYKKATDSKYTLVNRACYDTKYTVSGLTLGTNYDFRVSAHVAGKWREYSNVVRKQALPPTINVVRFIPESTGLKIKWAKRSDVDGLKLYKASSANGTYKLIKTFDKSANHYIDTAVKYNTNYYYKLVRFKGSYESGAKVFTGKYVLKTPVITYTRKDSKTILFTFNGDGCQDSFDYSVTSGSNKLSTATVNTTENTLLLENLDIGESYTVSVREKTKFAAGEYGKLTVIAAPKAVTGVKASLKIRGVRVNYNTESEAAGYLVYRNDGSGYKQIAKLEGKSTKSYFDNTVKYNTPCTYAVRAYAKSESGKDVPGDSSAASASVNMVLSAPCGIKAVRTTPTKITVSWNAAKYAGKYDLQYRAKGGKWITVSGINGKSKVIKKLKLGTKYYFRVRSVNGFGSSAYSSTVKRKLLPPTPEAPAVKKANYGLKVVYKPQKYADSYMIYRANSAKGKFKYIATVNGHKAKSYRDKTAPNSNCCYKIVCCVSKNGVNYMSARSAAGRVNNE